MALQEETFQSDRLALAGHPWLPEGKSAAQHHPPTIALSGPMTAVKDQVTGYLRELLAGAGLARREMTCAGTPPAQARMIVLKACWRSSKEVPMGIIGGLDVHRSQITTTGWPWQADLSWDLAHIS